MKPSPLPMLNGIKPSYLNLPHDKQYIGKPLLCYLRARFPFIAESVWRARLNSRIFCPLPPAGDFCAKRCSRAYGCIPICSI